MMIRKNKAIVTAAVMATLWACGGAVAADPPEPTKDPTPPASEPAEAPTTPPTPPKGDEPGLDELLGITPTAAGKTGIPDTAKTDLDRRLSAAEVGDLFQQAVTLMGDASKRLSAALEAARAKAADDASRSPEAWLQTQRVQEDVVRKLDAMIAELEKQGGGSSSSSRQQQQQQQDPNQPQNQPRSGSQKQPGKPGPDGQTDHDPPAGRAGELSAELDAARAAWGALPDRVRDMLQQGSGDKFSSLYERLTADYYKRLAEQGRTRGNSGSGDRKP